MKKLISLFSLIFIGILLNAQHSFTVPELTDEQKSEVLYSHVIAYCATGISFAKSKGVSPTDYGKFIGEQFKPYWNPGDGFSVFANRIIFILAGIHPDNEMLIIRQSENMVHFKMKNVDSMFKEGAAFGINYVDFLACSKGIISTLAEYMGVNFEQNVTIDGWYEIILSVK